MKKLTFETASKSLSAKIPHLKLIEFTNSTSNCTVLDLEYDEQFTGKYFKISQGAHISPKRKKAIAIKNNNDPIIQQKKRDTHRKNYQCDSPFQRPDVRDKLRDLTPSMTVRREQVFKEKYGSSFFASEEGKKKKASGMIDRYGTQYAGHSSEIVQKTHSTKIQKGLIKVYNGRTLPAIAEELGVPASSLYQAKAKYPELDIETYNTTKTQIHLKVKGLLLELGVEFQEEAKLDCKFRPDFLVSSHKLVIECNGDYWHSEEGLSRREDSKINPKTYHLEKRVAFERLGFTVLQISESDIYQSWSKLESLIKSRLHFNTRIGARTLTLSTERDVDFFSTNHLMGQGRGQFALLKDSNLKTLFGIRYWIKQKKILVIDRLCSEAGYTVQGGFTRVLAFILNENPHVEKVESFVDRNIGTGEYLKKSGFTSKTLTCSFVWYSRNKKIKFHRMRFSGNSGYESGFTKIWDSGQERWELDLVAS